MVVLAGCLGVLGALLSPYSSLEPLEASDPPALTFKGIQDAELVARLHMTKSLHANPCSPYPDTEACPGDWHEANLEPLRSFLLAEAERGTWVPLEGVPFS